MSSASAAMWHQRLRVFDVENRDEKIGLSRGKRIVITLSALVFFVLFFGVIAAMLMEPGGTFFVRYRGHPRIPITREHGLTVMVPLLALIATGVMAGFWRGLRHSWKIAQPGAIFPKLNSGETVLWSGKLGWRSFGGGRAVLMLMAIVVPALLVWWMWSIATGPDVLPVKLFWIMLPAALLFCQVLPAIIYGSDAIKSWLWDMFGTIAITSARIVWLTPVTSQIYRSISASDLVDVYMIDSDGKHGAMSVIKRIGDNVEHVDLMGLREPKRAYAAVQSLIHLPQSM